MREGIGQNSPFMYGSLSVLRVEELPRSVKGIYHTHSADTPSMGKTKRSSLVGTEEGRLMQSCAAALATVTRQEK